ncbi:MAG: thioredoxin domain-containing protein [Gemmatimonadota bacterium]
MKSVRHLLLALTALAAAPSLAPAQDALLAPRTKGVATAPVTVYEMSDFQCPFCRSFTTETFPKIEKEYIATGKVKWIFINYPLTSLHPNAMAAAEFASCASSQGRFWPTHDLLYAKQAAWAPLKDAGQYFMAQVDGLGLKRDQMLSCLQGGQARKLVEGDAAGAAKSGATSTPSFYIEGGMMSGAQPIEVFRPILDSIIKIKLAKKAAGR